MVRDTHTQHNDHVRRINELFADAKRRSSSAEPPKYVDIELINKKCNVHRGLTPQSTTQGTNHNFSNNYLGSRRGSAASNHSNSGLYNNYNTINNSNNGNTTNNGKSKSHLNLTTGLMTSSDEDAAETFIKDLQKRQSFSEHYHRDMQKKQIHDQLEAITGDKYRKRNVWNSDFKKNIEHPSAFPSLLRSSTPSTFQPRHKESIASQVANEVIEATAAAMRGENGDSLYGGGSGGNGGYLDRRSSINSLKNDSLNGSTKKLNATKRPSFGSTSSNLNNNYRYRSSTPSTFTPRQRESIASQVAAEVIDATVAAMRGENGDHLYGNGGYIDRRSSINSLKNDSLNGSTRKLNAAKRPSFGSTNSNLNNNYRRDSAVSLKSTPGSKRNSVDRTDGLMTNSFRGGSVPPSTNLTGGGRRGSTSYDSSYGSLPRRRNSTLGYDSPANTTKQYGSLPRKNATTKDPKRYVSTGNLLTRKLSSEPRDYVNTMGSSKLYSSPIKSTPMSSSLKSSTPFKTHSILRKSSSPTTQYESFDSDTSAGTRNSLTKENLTRHVRILEDAEHEKRRIEHNLLEAIQDTDDLFQEYHNNNNNGKRFSIDSLDCRKNSAIDLIEEDILANLSMNDINETAEDTTRSTTTTKTERKIHNGNLLCDTNSTCTDISLLNRDYYNIPKNNPKYSGLSRNNGNTNNINSNGLKSGSKLQQQQQQQQMITTAGVKSSSTLNLSSIENDNNNNSNNSSNNMNSSNNPNKCNFEIQCETGIRKHNNGINNLILQQQQNGQSSLSSTSSQSHNHNNNNKKISSLQSSSTIKDHNNINCFDCNPHLQQTIQQQQQHIQQQQHQTALLSSSSNITNTNHNNNNNSNIINKKNKKNLLISRSVDDLRLEDHLFNNNYQTTELLKYNKQPQLQKLQQQQQQLQQQLNYNCCNTDQYNKNQLNRNSLTNNNNNNNNNRNIINHHQSSTPSSVTGSSRILTNINNNTNNINNINNTNQNTSNKILQHNFPKQKSALYQIKNKHYSMDNLLTAVNQHFIDIDNNYNNNSNNNLKNGFTYQGDTDRPQFVAVTSLDECQAIRCAEFHPNGKLYAVGSNSKTFRICEYPSLVDIREDHTAYQPVIVYEKQKYHKGSIYCMDWSPDGELIATGSNDKTIKLMRYNDITKQLEGREIELTMHDGTIRDVCFIEDTSNKASLLISGGAGDNKIYVTDCGTATPFQSLSGHSGHILSLYNWGGAMFVSGSHDKTIRFWDLRTRSCVNTVTPSTQPGLRHGSPVAAVCVDPSGRLLVSGHEDSSCVLYDIRGNRPIQCFKPHNADIRSIRFSPSAYYLLTAGYDKKLMLTDLQGDLTLQLPSVTVANHNDKVISGRWHPTDFSFLSTSADKTCVLWALTSKP